MKIPKSVNVGGHRIPVTYGNVDSNAFGYYRHSDVSIHLQPGMKHNVIEETFVHEVVEAINNLYELGLPHRTIQTLGAALHQALGPHMK